MDTTKLSNRLDNQLQKQQKEQRVSVPTGQELILKQSDYVALTSDALSIIQENLKKQPLTHTLFDIVKSPSGGATVFTIPGLSGEEVQKELTGIVLTYTTPRAYWDSPDPVEGTPPVCYSRDSLISHEGKPCYQCPLNDFGSKGNGETNAKACREAVELFLLRPESIVPIIVRVPVSSKKLFLKYLTRLVGNMTPLSAVVTRITLTKTTNKTGQPYAQFHFDAVGMLSPEEAAAARAYGQKLIEVMDAVEMAPELAEVS